MTRQNVGTTLHHYSIPSSNWAQKGSGEFDEGEYFTTLKKCVVYG